MRDDSQSSDGTSVRANPFRLMTSAVELIDDVARAWPEAIAVSAGRSHRITYRTLLTSADSLAAELMELGAGTDVPIGICIDRSIEHIIAILGALRAGSCFLPLDPDWPAERLSHVLDDAGAPIVIAEPRLMNALATPGRTILSSAPEARRHLPRPALPAT